MGWKTINNASFYYFIYVAYSIVFIFNLIIEYLSVPFFICFLKITGNFYHFRVYLHNKYLVICLGNDLWFLYFWRRYWWRTEPSVWCISFVLSLIPRRICIAHTCLMNICWVLSPESIVHNSRWIYIYSF